MNAYLIQVLVIIALFFIGFIFTTLLCGDSDFILRAVIAFPAGLSIYSLAALIILIAGIRFNLLSVGIFVLLVLAGAVVFAILKKNKSFTDASIKQYLLLVVFVSVIAIISVSGLIPVSISNDSIYYYSLYPQTIVIDGAYDLSYDVFLTDVGQSIAMINTLPFLFGFKETFGILIAMLFSFSAFFVYIWYERLTEILTKPRMISNGGVAGYIAANTNKCIKIGTILVAVFLISTTPYLCMGQWVLANAYFMEFLFMIFGITYYVQKTGIKSLCIVVVMFVMMLSMMRMEGGLFAGILILCLSMYEIKNSELLEFYLIPSLILIVPYYIVLYLKFKVDPLYSFLDIKNALLQVGFLFVIGLYLAFFRNRIFIKFQGKNLSYTLIALLCVGNAALLLYDHDKYITNAMAFLKNIVLGNAWGYFGFFVIVILLLLPHKKDLSVNGSFCISYVLLCLAVLFARNGALRVGSGDSGNRVLLQIVPFVIYTLFEEMLLVFVSEE